MRLPGRFSFALFGEPWPLAPVEGAGGYASGAEAGVSAKMPDKNKKQNLFGNILTFAYNRIILYSAPQRRNTHETRRSSP